MVLSLRNWVHLHDGNIRALDLSRYLTNVGHRAYLFTRQDTIGQSVGDVFKEDGVWR